MSNNKLHNLFQIQLKFKTNFRIKPYFPLLGFYQQTYVHIYLSHYCILPTKLLRLFFENLIIYAFFCYQLPYGTIFLTKEISTKYNFLNRLQGTADIIKFVSSE